MKIDCIYGFHEGFPKLFLNSYYYFNQFLFTFTLISSSLLVFQASADSSVIHDDLHRLLSFKSSLPNSTSLLQDWLSTATNKPCNFTGVSCRNFRVTSIDLTNFSLNVDFSSVSTYLVPLENLESLVLKNANVTGSLSSLARSQCGASLKTVDLAENRISGPVSDILSFGVCSSILSLNLSANFMEVPVIETGVSGFRIGLRVLDLSSNSISGQNVVEWLQSEQFSELQYLSLKGNKLGGEIPILDLKNLSYLDLSMNNFSSGFPSFRDCSNLEHLDLSSNSFYGGSDVSTSLSSCEKLSFLNLTHNQFKGAVPKLPSGSLQFLYLKENGFQGVIPPHLSDLCSTLVELDLSSNNLSGMVPDSFGACSALELLDISNNNFNGKLPMDTFLKMNSLKNLFLAFNEFFGTLPESLSNFETFDVSSNNISGLIPPGICQKSNLKVLYLQNNLLTGTIPEGLSNCTQLVSLDLSFNFLSGRIPSSLGSLSKLRDLIAWLNQLSGEIPEELMYLQSLENLILDFNDLSGSIPASLSNCTNLNWISLSNNLLSGEIPASLGSLERLAILKLGNNLISGRIPSELGDCRSLFWLDLNTNSLNGAIPPALFKQSGNIAPAFPTGKKCIYIKNDGSKQCHGSGNLLEFGGIRQEQLGRISIRKQSCKFTRVYQGITMPSFDLKGSMIFLDLSYNNLDGSIPKELSSAYSLLVLSLSHNNLSGPLPQEINGLKNMAILDLSHNRLNGSIPNSMEDLNLLGEIDLSNNNLSGKIPESAPFDTFPEDKFVNNSGLCGYPLPPCATDGSEESANQQNISSSSSSSYDKQTAAAAFAVGMVFGLLSSLICMHYVSKHF